MRRKIQDVILLLVFVVLVIAAIMPVNDSTKNKDNGDVSSSDVLPEITGAGIDDDTLIAHKVADKVIQPGASEPLKNTTHYFFPLIAGSEWIFRVEGPDDLVTEKIWTLKIDTTPTADSPAKARSGFGDSFTECSFFTKSETIRTDCLPFVEPLMFRGNKPTVTTGALLPNYRYAIEGAVWKQFFDRSVKYESPDKHGKIHFQNASGQQSDRAMVSSGEQAMVPAGVFDSLRVEWIGRIELKAGKRKVLAAITTDPFRTETTWFAPGVGLVRRRVEYLKPKRSIISFDLIRYNRP